MSVPPNVIDCWFVSEDEYVQALKDNRPYSGKYGATDQPFLKCQAGDSVTEYPLLFLEF